MSKGPKRKRKKTTGKIKFSSLKLFHWQIWQGSLQQGSHLARIPIETLATFAIARSLNWATWQRKGKKKASVYTPLGLRTAASALYDSNIFTHSCQNKMRSQQIRKSWGNMEKSLMNGGFNGKTIHQYIICIYIYIIKLYEYVFPVV